MQRLPPVLHREAAPRRLRRPRRALRAPLRPAQGRAEVDPRQREALRAAKLKALVANTGLVHDETWLFEERLGPALAVARRRGEATVNVVVEEGDAGVLARQARYFAAPDIHVWRVDGRVLAPAEPSPLPVHPPLHPDVASFADLLAAAGADPVVEHGRLIGEVLGLEVARVEVDDHGPHLEVGVGRFDREAHALLGSAAIDEVVALVRRHRRVEADSHPLQLLARSRWLRSLLVRDPSLVGADHLAPMAPTVAPPDLRTPWPAPAAGVDANGEPVVVVASVGVDLDLVPMAADARAADGRGARLLLAVPRRDDHPITRALAGALRQPAGIVTVDVA